MGWDATPYALVLDVERVAYTKTHGGRVRVLSRTPGIGLLPVPGVQCSSSSGSSSTGGTASIIRCNVILSSSLLDSIVLLYSIEFIDKLIELIKYQYKVLYNE